MSSNQDERPRVAIIGGGLAGCSTAIHVAALRPDLVGQLEILERARFPRDKPCGGGLTGLAIGILRSFDPEILETGVVEVRNVLLVSGEILRPVRLRQPMAVVHRRDLDQKVARVATARGVELTQGVTAQKVISESNAVKVHAEKTRSVTALIGADGARSVVRPSVSVKRGGLARLIEVVTPDRMDQPAELRSTIVFDFSATRHGLQGYTWRFPCEVDGVLCINWGIFDSRIYENAPRADLPALLDEFMTSHDYPTVRGDWVSHPVRRFDPDDHFSAPNVFLIGDAAGVDPALGEGISLALDYGDLAAHCVIDAFDRNDFSFATFRDQLFSHPVGQSLLTRHQMALQLYRPGSHNNEAALAIMEHWLESA